MPSLVKAANSRQADSPIGRRRPKKRRHILRAVSLRPRWDPSAPIALLRSRRQAPRKFHWPRPLPAEVEAIPPSARPNFRPFPFRFPEHDRNIEFPSSKSFRFAGRWPGNSDLPVPVSTDAATGGLRACLVELEWLSRSPIPRSRSDRTMPKEASRPRNEAGDAVRAMRLGFLDHACCIHSSACDAASLSARVGRLSRRSKLLAIICGYGHSTFRPGS